MKKKLPLYVLEIALQLQHWSKFAQKTYVSEKVLIKVKMSCALELKPHLHSDNDPWKKLLLYVLEFALQLQHWSKFAQKYQ